MGSSSGAVEKAAKALATAGGIAHVAFFSLFAFRVVSSGAAGKVVNLVFALLARSRPRSPPSSSRPHPGRDQARLRA
jgi:hypothetical protein